MSKPDKDRLRRLIAAQNMRTAMAGHLVPEDRPKAPTGFILNTRTPTQCAKCGPSCQCDPAWNE